VGRAPRVQGRMRKVCKILDKILERKRKLERPKHTGE